MLAMCLEDGLTCNKHVYKRGDIFVLPTQMEGDYSGLSPNQLASKQRQVYGRQLFSVPTGEEVIAAHKAGNAPLEMLSEKERYLVVERKSEEGLQAHESAEAIKEKMVEKNPELKQDEEEDATAKPVQVEHVAAVTDTPPPSPFEPKKAKKTTQKTSAGRKAKKE